MQDETIRTLISQLVRRAPVTSATFPENSVLLFMALPTSRQ